jgi:hypothetical protein
MYFSAASSPFSASKNVAVCSTILFFIWPSQMLIWHLTDTPEHCHILGSPQTALQEALKTVSIILFILILTVSFTADMVIWDCNSDCSECYNLQVPAMNCTAYSTSSSICAASWFSLLNQLLSIMALDCMDDSQIQRL